MKYAPVIPPGAEKLLPADLRAHFCFANEAAKDPHYAEFYRHKPGVVMDCPIYEGKDPLTPIELQVIAKLVKPDFLIIPDVRHDYEGTIKQLATYLDVIDSEVSTGVIQGLNLRELAACARDMYQAGLRQFAIPKDVILYCKDVANRPWLVWHLLHKVFPTRVKFHFLGADWPYYDEANCDMPEVVSVDTAEPFNSALRWHTMINRPPRRPVEWWDMATEAARVGLLLKNNINWVRDKVHDHAQP